MHSRKGIDKFKSDLKTDVNDFMNTSRIKSLKAQNREILTIQPKESLSTFSKAKITIKNYLGGFYYLTTDEIKIENKNIYLIEGKHTKSDMLPSINDIKDGLLKMILYCNLSTLSVNEIKYNKIPVLCLTSGILNGKIISSDNKQKISDFVINNNFKDKQKNLIDTIFKEADYNKFLVEIKNIEC